MDDGALLAVGDQAGAHETSGDGADAHHIMAVAFPRAVARAKLRDAATVGVDYGVGRRVGTLVEIIRHAVVVAVHRKNLPSCGTSIQSPRAKYSVSDEQGGNVPIVDPGCATNNAGWKQLQILRVRRRVGER